MIEKNVVTVGALYCRNVRAALYSLDLKYYEDKGVLQSVFHYEGSPRNMKLFSGYIDNLIKLIEIDKERKQRELEDRRNAHRWWKPQTWFK